MTNIYMAVADDPRIMSGLIIRILQHNIELQSKAETELTPRRVYFKLDYVWCNDREDLGNW